MLVLFRFGLPPTLLLTPSLGYYCYSYLPILLKSYRLFYPSPSMTPHSSLESSLYLGTLERPSCAASPPKLGCTIPFLRLLLDCSLKLEAFLKLVAAVCGFDAPPLLMSIPASYASLFLLSAIKRSSYI